MVLCNYQFTWYICSTLVKFSIRDAKHATLYNTIRPLTTGLVKKKIQKALNDALTTGLEYVDGKLEDGHNRMNKAKG